MRRFAGISTTLMFVLSFTEPVLAQTAAPQPATLSVRPQIGEYALHVHGHGPASSQIMLRLSMLLSRDLPTISLNDMATHSDANGDYDAVVPLASDYWYGSLVNVEADSPESGYHASASVTVAPPNQGFKSEADTVPSQ